MFLAHTNLAHRVAHRFLKSKSETDPHDHAQTWMLPSREVGIPDDVVVQHSDGCTVTTEDIEAAVSKTRGVLSGSCKFSEVHADDGTNRVRFEIVGSGGQKLEGTVTVNIVAREMELTTFSLIELDDTAMAL